MRPPASAAPTAPPWEELRAAGKTGGYLTIYYSDNMSRLPVRWVTKPGDNKSDPNIETLTYGLFSTCAPAMRKGIVTRKYKHLFFGTLKDGRRMLSGYYRIRWFTRGPLGSGDICLAADTARFIKDPIPFRDVDRKCGTDLSRRFRGMRLLTDEQCERMLRLLSSQPDASREYLHEIDRLERFNLRYGGYRYVGWKQPDKFSWEYAGAYLKKWAANEKSGGVVNSSPSDFWMCSSCSQPLKNKALLKRCPSCGAMGSLRPMEEKANG